MSLALSQIFFNDNRSESKWGFEDLDAILSARTKIDVSGDLYVVSDILSLMSEEQTFMNVLWE